jgi:predicted MFS family arabinose efflux permease
LGNISVDDWGVDTFTYGLTWSTFSLASAVLMYVVSSITDRNLKAALIVGVAGNGVVFIIWSIGSGAALMFLLNFLWAIPFAIWLGAERSLLILSVSEEMKGRALGTFQVLMSLTSIIAAYIGALLWEASGSLRNVYGLAGIVMLCSLLYLIPLLKTIKIQQPES